MQRELSDHKQIDSEFLEFIVNQTQLFKLKAMNSFINFHSHIVFFCFFDYFEL